MNQRMYSSMDTGHSMDIVLFLRNVVPTIFDLLADKTSSEVTYSLRDVAARFRAGEATKEFALAAANHAWRAFNYGTADNDYAYAGLMVDSVAATLDPTALNHEEWFIRAKDNALKIIGHERMVLLLTSETELETRLHDGIEYLNSLNGH